MFRIYYKIIQMEGWLGMEGKIGLGEVLVDTELQTDMAQNLFLYVAVFPP